MLTESYRNRLLELAGVGQDNDLSKKYDNDILYGLKERAKNFEDFKDFSRDYSIGGNWGIYYHLTDNPNFKYSKDVGSRDMSSMSNGEASEKGSFMVTASLDNWHEYYNVDPDTDLPRDTGRHYVAIVDLSNVKDFRATPRGFGHEIYLNSNQAPKARIIKVAPIDEALKFNERFQDAIPQSEEALRKIWIQAHKNK